MSAHSSTHRPAAPARSRRHCLQALGLAAWPLLAAAGPGPAALRLAGWQLTDLGELPGGSDLSQALALNARGDATGISSATGPDGTTEDHAFVWRRRTAALQDLPTRPGAPGYWSRGHDINRSGQVVGESRGEACLWQGGLCIELGMLMPWGGYSVAHGLNDAGVAVGASKGRSGIANPVWWAVGSEPLELPGLSAQGTGVARAVNEALVMVGWSRATGRGDLAVRWVDGVVEDLGWPASGEARAINRAGVIVGTAGGRAWRWRRGRSTELGSVDGSGAQAAALGINRSGQVVGRSSRQGQGVATGWLDGTTPQDLNDLPGVAGSGWRLLEASDINDAGLIVGYGHNPAGLTRAFLLSPA